MSSKLKKKLDETVEEKNFLSAMVKDLEDIVFKVNLNEPKSPDVIVQSPYVDYADSECSFKTAPSSIHADVSSTNNFTPTNQIRPSNLFYDHQIDGSGKNHSKKGPHIFTAFFNVEFGEIVGCKIGLYPRSQDCAQSEDKGKVKVVFKVKLDYEKTELGPSLMLEVCTFLAISFALLALLILGLNMSSSKLSKLDMLLVSINVFDNWPNAGVIILERIYSNHCSAMLNARSLNFGLVPLTIFNSGLPDPNLIQFANMIRGCWETNYRVENLFSKIENDIVGWYEEDIN
ncbi:hypothetical protein OSB04_024473 [Centaurea solstitialis]|uniref:Uncharacterized protein n=1 Tax=Centaurea solstitialis TaxID=347529 RepID=A0AA38SXW4_9ASTR|nr:hypothetical protein OSB04_024473 [Centaurea solstitialis]